VRLDDSLPLMLWTARPDMSCEHASRAWREFTGCTAQDAAGNGLSQYVHPEDLACWLDTCVRAFDAREAFELEYRLRRHDGEYRWMLDRAAPRFAPDGLFLGYLGLCIDIDERKRAELALARSLERERLSRTAAEDAGRAKDAFLSAVLAELQAPAQAIATWAAHLRSGVPPAREAHDALAAIERGARLQDRVIASLLELSPGAGMRPAPLSPQAPLLAGVRVLVVDDDATSREALLKVLRVAGAHTRAVAGAAEALEALGDWRPDVMLSDLGLHGDEACVLIRALRALPAERGGCLRAAALTDGDAPQAGRRVVAAGYDAQLVKPVEPVALLATLARLVQPASI
jgi:PAS domain S-box-containing protein